ncbi:IclR family transcriptional regulator [Halomonas sp. FME16]|uniref:IclR family transcriptional regulator n=1 Tax=Halomonas citrativorans TaxID=2742612 RepID=A0ABR9F7N3_9GAMM|nr:IclR family transcriptional regulator [Halomonas citrativorans]
MQWRCSLVQKQNRVEAVERALTILEAFTDQERSLSLVTLAERTGLYKSTILRLIGSLERFGYIVREGDGTYALGPSLWRLGNLFRHTGDMGELIRPQLTKLVGQTQETASFFIRLGNQRMCLYRLNSPKPARHHLDEGALLPIERGATGRVLLAFSGEEGAFYDDIRTKGYAFSKGERDPDVAAIALPVLDRHGVMRGAISVSALITRLTDDKVESTVELLKASCDTLRETMP